MTCQVRSFRGFEVAFGETGIQGLRVVFYDGPVSSWIGQYNGACVTSRSTQDNVDALEAGFDVSCTGILVKATSNSHAEI